MARSRSGVRWSRETGFGEDMLGGEWWGMVEVVGGSCWWGVGGGVLQGF